MNLPKLNYSDIKDETGNRIKNRITEDIALSEELRYRASGTRINERGEAYFDEGQLWGFDDETADYSKMISYFTDARVTKRSPSLISLVLRKLAVRFSNELERDKVALTTQIKKLISYFTVQDIEVILSEAKNDGAWFGDAGIQNQVFPRKDNPLNRPNSKMIKLKNDGFTIVRK